MTSLTNRLILRYTTTGTRALSALSRIPFTTSPTAVDPFSHLSSMLTSPGCLGPCLFFLPFLIGSRSVRSVSVRMTISTPVSWRGSLVPSHSRSRLLSQDKKPLCGSIATGQLQRWFSFFLFFFSFWWFTLSSEDGFAHWQIWPTSSRAAQT